MLFINNTISIHAPRTGSDVLRGERSALGSPISIHAPRTGSDRACRKYHARTAHFNPRSPHGERHTVQRHMIMALGFQSTLPARGATRDDCICRIPRRISIHAPRTGSDPRRGRTRRRNGDFNPRSPHGERQGAVRECCERKQFQSTLPARGATRKSPGR